MMKKTYLALACLALALTACDNVDPDERLTYVEPVQVSRAVLIEDFTGQRCVNCPKATEEIHRLQEEYGDSTVIAVAIHSGPFGKSVKGEPTPLYTTLGDTYFNYWNLEAQPIGLVDRLGAFEYPDWAAGVYYEIGQKAAVSLAVNNEYDEAANSVNIGIDVIGLDSTTVSGKLQVWLTQDSIIDYQLMPDGSTNEQYVHNHVLRTAVNGDWGEDMTVARGDVKSFNYTLSLESAWVPRHCNIVAFVYDDTGVKQVIQKKIINP